MKNISATNIQKPTQNPSAVSQTVSELVYSDPDSSHTISVSEIFNQILMNL
jgi:hypothetical protein